MTRVMIAPQMVMITTRTKTEKCNVHVMIARFSIEKRMTKKELPIS